MDIGWMQNAHHSARAERLPSVMEFPFPQRPERTLDLTGDVSTLSDRDLTQRLQVAAGYQAWAEASEGQYAAAEEYLSSQMKEREREVYAEIYPEGKPKGVTVDEAKNAVLDNPGVRALRLQYEGVKQGHLAVKAYARSYARISMTYSQVIKYRVATGDRPPDENPRPAELAEESFGSKTSNDDGSWD